VLRCAGVGHARARVDVLLKQSLHGAAKQQVVGDRSCTEERGGPHGCGRMAVARPHPTRCASQQRQPAASSMPTSLLNITVDKCIRIVTPALTTHAETQNPTNKTHRGGGRAGSSSSSSSSSNSSMPAC